MRRISVLAIVVLVGLYDALTGLRMLVSAEPWRAHGPDTLWAHAGPAAAQLDAIAQLTMSLYRRVGAFSLHAGVITLMLAWLGRRHRPALSALLVTYLITGVAFLATDAAYFRGTFYFAVKQALGAVWAAAVALHFWPTRPHAAPR